MTRIEMDCSCLGATSGSPQLRKLPNREEAVCNHELEDINPRYPWRH